MARSITIRNVPDGVYRTLCTSAATAGLSLSDYLLADITRRAERPSISDVLHRAAARPGGVDTAAIVAAVREGRDRA